MVVTVVVAVLLLAVVFEVDWVHAVTSARVVILVNRNVHFFAFMLVSSSFILHALSLRVFPKRSLNFF